MEPGPRHAIQEIVRPDGVTFQGSVGGSRAIVFFGYAGWFEPGIPGAVALAASRECAGASFELESLRCNAYALCGILSGHTKI
jgi:hypothetical protein